MFDSMREGQQRSRYACCLSQLLIRCVGLQAEFSSQAPSDSITIEPGALFTPQTAQHPDNLLTMLQPTWKRLFYGQYQAVVIPLCGFLWFCQLLQYAESLVFVLRVSSEIFLRLPCLPSVCTSVFSLMKTVSYQRL